MLHWLRHNWTPWKYVGRRKILYSADKTTAGYRLYDLRKCTVCGEEQERSRDTEAGVRYDDPLTLT